MFSLQQFPAPVLLSIRSLCGDPYTLPRPEACQICCFAIENDIFRLLSAVAFIIIIYNRSTPVQTEGSKGILVLFGDLNLFFQPAAVRIQIGERFF